MCETIRWLAGDCICSALWGLWFLARLRLFRNWSLNGAEVLPGVRVGALGSRQVRRRGQEGGEWCSLQKLIQNDNVVFYLESKIIILAVSLCRAGERKGQQNLGCSGYDTKGAEKPVQFWRGRKGCGLALKAWRPLTWATPRWLLQGTFFGAEKDQFWAEIFKSPDSHWLTIRKLKKSMCEAQIFREAAAFCGKRKGLQGPLGALPALRTSSAGSIPKLLPLF